MEKSPRRREPNCHEGFALTAHYDTAIHDCLEKQGDLHPQRKNKEAIRMMRLS